MSQTLHRIFELIEAEDIRVSDHGYDELANDGLLLQDILASVSNAVVVEDYPNYHKGPCVLLLQKDQMGCQFMCCGGFLKAQIHQRS